MDKQVELEEPQEIGAYQARIHWSALLKRVEAGGRYVISKRHQGIAALVPLEEWQQRHGDAESAEAGELAALVAQLQARNKEAETALDEAFSELAETRRVLKAWQAQREQMQGAAHDA